MEIIDIKASASLLLDRIRASITNQDFISTVNVFQFIEKFIAQRNPGLYLAICEDASWETIVNEYNSRMHSWKETFSVGSYIDCYSETDGAWYKAKLLEFDPTDRDRVNVHYLGWQSKYDGWISLSQSLICPSGCRVKEKGSGNNIKRCDGSNSNFHQPDKVENLQVDSSHINIDAIDNKNSKVAVILSRSGRAVKQVTPANASVKSKDVKPKKTSSVRGNEADAADSNDWVCAFCSRLEAIDESFLVLCDGPCKRSFHEGCLKSMKSKGKGHTNSLPGDDFWMCQDCSMQSHSCFLCSKKGKDVLDVVKCSFNQCGKFYHMDCLCESNETFISPLISLCQREYPPNPYGPNPLPTAKPSVASNQPKVATVVASTSAENPAKRTRIPSSKLKESISSPSKGTSAVHVAAEKQMVDSFSFKCPYHQCNTCSAFYGGTKDKGGSSSSLLKCLKCPRGYHVECIPPGSRWNAWCLLCPLHPNEYLPSKDIESEHSSGKGAMDSFWDQLVIPDIPPEVDNPMDYHFKLPTSLQDDISSQPGDFKLITRLEYDMLPDKERSLTLYPTEDTCKCIGCCNENCLNRMLNIECCDGKDTTTTVQCNCNIGGGGDCGNRNLQNKRYARTEKIREGNMGWGLKAREDISTGDLLIEYLGEVIDEKEMQKRMSQQRKYTPNDHDFYIMELDQGYFVDGKFKGNYSRFINHSCDPNCELQRWIVKGRMRIGIFALRDIEMDESLSYDYQFDTKEEDAFKCYCGTAKCRGTMAPKKKTDVMVSLPRNSSGNIEKSLLSNHERAILVRLGRSEEERKQAQFASPEQELQKSYVGRLLPGDNIIEIRNGPHKPTFKSARAARLFLIRNIRTDFLIRRRLQWKKSKVSSEKYKLKG